MPIACLFSNFQTIENKRIFSTQMWKFRLARFARSRKLPCQNIVKKCDDNNYTNSIVMKIMITNTYARPMCKASTLICCRFIWYPSPHTKKLATPLMSPWQKKIVSPLRSLPPPPPIQNCFRRACPLPDLPPARSLRSLAVLLEVPLTRIFEPPPPPKIFWLRACDVMNENIFVTLCVKSCDVMSENFFVTLCVKSCDVMSEKSCDIMRWLWHYKLDDQRIMSQFSSLWHYALLLHYWLEQALSTGSK